MLKSKELIFQKLTGDQTLLNLVPAENIMYLRPQQEIVLPSVIFWEVSGVKDRIRNFEDEVFQIDIYAEDNIDEIAERVDEILDGKRLKGNAGETIVVWLERILKGEDFESDIYHKYLQYRVITNLNI